MFNVEAVNTYHNDYISKYGQTRRLMQQVGRTHMRADTRF